MDSPSEVLYWTLTPAQRREIAEKLGAARDTDQSRYSDDKLRSSIWLRRLRLSGSRAAALQLAAKYHWYELRRIEDALHDPRARAWHDQLEATRERQYRLLSLSP